MTKSKLLLAALLACLLAPVAALADTLPDLGGKKVVVVTENAYPPLQFIDPRPASRSAGNMTRWTRSPSG